MKKKNNLITYITKAAYAMALMTSLYACMDEEIASESNIKEGIPVEVSLAYTAPQMTNVTTRGLDESQESQVNDLYILIFSNGDSKVRKPGSGLYEDVTASGGSIKLKTTSGESLIYGIANAKSNQQKDMVSDLDNVTSLAELNKFILTAGLTSTGVIDVDRTSPSLVMSGAFKSKSPVAGKPDGYCAIGTGTSSLNGTVQLKRLDARIKFNIHIGSRVTKIEPRGWRVCNVPTQSYMLAQDKVSAGGTVQANYANTEMYNNQTIHEEEYTKPGTSIKEKIHTFSFYQFENFKNLKKGVTLTDSKEREKEIKNFPDLTNTGEFVYVEPCATYVEFKTYLEIKKYETGAPRIAEIKITVLLGGKNPGDTQYDVTNFNTWRNTKYTYDVTINDVEDIVTEVTTDPNNESRPGLEGDVIDAEDEVRVLDAHYNCFNIALKKDQVETMSILTHTPFGEVQFVADAEGVTPAPNQGDYKWIKFRRTPNNDPTLLANYANQNGDLSGLLDIFSLRQDVLNNKANNSTLHYTIFVDEYYYKSAPNGEPWGSDRTKYWTHFVNQPDRYIMLIYTPNKSQDKESSYSKSRYFIKQKSIQTYYSTSNLTKSGTALGMEHVNEIRNPSFSSGIRAPRLDKENGNYNAYWYYDGMAITDGRGKSLWNLYVDMDEKKKYPKADNTKNTFKLKTDVVQALCLSRNRDSNGNGLIDGSEMEWYAPTYKQLSGMYLGSTSLPSPLFTPPADDNSVIYDDIDYHFMTSDDDLLWGQEGCSNGGKRENLGSRYANDMRCVRNLGIEGYQEKQVPEQPYVAEMKNGHYVFDMSRVAESNLRQSSAKALGFHSNFRDSRNNLYKKFELAKDFHSTRYTPGTDTWYRYNIGINGKDLCQDYLEIGDQERGQGVWRTPNQRELLVIFNTLGAKEMINSFNEGMYTCTRWEYQGKDKNISGTYPRIFGINPAGRNMFLDNVNKTSGIHSTLRCVRDISK